MAVVNDDDGHISKESWTKLQSAFLAENVRRLNAGENMIYVDKFSYDTNLAEIHFTRGESIPTVADLVKTFNLKLVGKEDLLQRRRPTKLMSGLITAPAASLPDETLTKAFKQEVLASKVDGRLEFVSTVTVARSGNKILRILVDDIAVQSLGARGNTLNLMGMGEVLFSDVKGQNTTLNKTAANLQSKARDLEERRKRLAEETEALKAAEEKLENERESQSVGSCGISGMNIGVAMDTTETVTTEASASQKSGQAEDYEESEDGGSDCVLYKL